MIKQTYLGLAHVLVISVDYLYTNIIILKLTKVSCRPMRVIIIHKSKQKEFITLDISQILLLT